VRPRIQQRHPHNALGMAQRIAKAEESAVIVRHEIEAVQPERIGKLGDALDLGVVRRG
jgi:hypothetical protein